MIGHCRDRDIRFVVLMFPNLYELNEDYPFTEIHGKVRTAVEEAGGIFIDVLPAVMGRDAAELRVHPTDHHPNEIVHRIAGELLAEELADRRLVTGDEHEP